MLTTVAACVVARRAGLLPRPPAAPLAPPERRRPRRSCRRPRRGGGGRSSARGRCSRTSGCTSSARAGWRLPPDVLVGLLRRHRSDAARWASRRPRWAGRSCRGCSTTSRRCAAAVAAGRRRTTGDLPGARRGAAARRCCSTPVRSPSSTAVLGWSRRRHVRDHPSRRARSTSSPAPAPTRSSRSRRPSPPHDVPPGVAGLAQSLADLAGTRPQHARGAAAVIPDILRPHAEDEHAAELAALGRADDRPRPPNWKLSPWAVVTYLLGGVLADGTVDHAEVRRPAPARRDRRRHARHRPGAAAARRAGHGQDVGQRAPRRGDQRRLDAARPGHGRHDRGVAALRLELRPAAGRGPDRGGARAEPGLPGDADRQAGAHRGADAHAVGGAGRPRHDPLREGPAGARAGHRGRRRCAGST